jgi:hypothetical protein
MAKRSLLYGEMLASEVVLEFLLLGWGRMLWRFPAATGIPERPGNPVVVTILPAAQLFLVPNGAFQPPTSFHRARVVVSVDFLLIERFVTQNEAVRLHRQLVA